MLVSACDLPVTLASPHVQVPGSLLMTVHEPLRVPFDTRMSKSIMGSCQDGG